MLTPSSFSTLFEKHSKNPAHFEATFRPQDKLFFCQEPQLHNAYRRTWIFDADDTLWEDNLYYEQIVHQLIEYIESFEVPLTRAEIRQVIDDVEHETIAEEGFGALGFAKSMQRAFQRLSHEYCPHAPIPTDLFSSVLPSLLSLPKEVPQSTIDTLQAIRAEGDALILFTQGPIEVQQAKIARSGIAHLFHALAIGTEKSVEFYRAVISSFSAEPGEIHVVGNSLRSEILPALELGYRAFHYLNPNSWHAGTMCEIDRSRYIEIQSLSELIAGNKSDWKSRRE